MKTGGNLVILDSVKGKRGHPKTVRVTVQAGNHFWNPNTAVCRVVGDQLLKDSQSSPVRFPKERLGEVVNLANPEEQRRSVAAILAKKYKETNQALKNVYNASISRELSEKECSLVFRIMEEMDGRIKGRLEAQPAGDSGAGSESLGVDAGCAQPYPDQPDLPPSEPDSEDSASVADEVEDSD